MATEVATQQDRKNLPLPQQLVMMLDGRKEQFRALMKSDEETEAFLRIVKNAVIRDPQIAEADQTSVFLECQKAAQDGLVLDGREAVLNRYNKSVKVGNKWETKVVVAYIPMITGIKKRVRNSGTVTAWNFGLVYENEVKAGRFRFWRDDLGLHLNHEPMMPAIDGPKGNLVAAYSAVRMRDGTVDYEVMDVDQLNAIRARTSSKKRGRDGEPDTIVGPWVTDYEEMCKKTVARRHAKSLPVSADDRAVIERVDSQYDFTKSADEEIYQMPADVPASVKNKRQTSAADKLRTAKPQPEEDTSPHDDDGVVDEPDDSQGEDATPNPDDAF